jgi:hypothetical protein
VSDEPRDPDSFFDEEDLPMADENIRLNYEAALGGCMLAFNQLDNLLGEVISTILMRLGREDMVKSSLKDGFRNKVRLLDLLKTSKEGGGLVNIAIKDFYDVSGERNTLAHAHFDQNPYQGDYILINSSGDETQHYTSEQILRVAANIRKVWNSLRYAEAYYAFIDYSVDTLPE